MALSPREPYRDRRNGTGGETAGAHAVRERGWRALMSPSLSAALGDLTIMGHPVSHGEKRLTIRTAAPEPGQDNEEILTGIGYTKAQIADLAQRGVI